MSLSAAVPAGVALIAATTLAGAWLAGRVSRWRRLSMACAAAALVAVVLADLVPDIWRELDRAGLPWWAAAGALGGGIAAADALCRRGCACDSGPGWAGGPASHGSTGTITAAPGTHRALDGRGGASAAAAALAAHRALEGAAVAVAGSAAVIAALALHAAGEGFALAALLRDGRRGRRAALLAMACLSPAAGALALSQLPLPAPASPIITSLIAGVLLRSALAAWRVRLPPHGTRDPGGASAAGGRGRAADETAIQSRTITQMACDI